MSNQPSPRVDWRAADLRNVSFACVSLEGADLRAADLSGSNFTSANLKNADLRGAKLVGTNFQNASLYGAKMQGVEAQSADFRGADLRQANLGGAYLDGAMMPPPQISQPASKATLPTPKGQTTRHSLPSPSQISLEKHDPGPAGGNGTDRGWDKKQVR